MSAEERAGVLFVMPPGGAISSFSEHLGTAFLRTMLERAGIPSQQYLPERNVPLRTFAAFLAERRPPVVGFTAYETNLHTCRAMARVVHEALPDTVVMVGGPNATFSPEETLELLRADVCLRGAGEGTIVGILQAIVGADRARRRLPELLDDFPNLVIRSRDGVHRTRAGDLSSFPAQYFRCLDDIPSPYQAGLVARAESGLLTARGCNQHCTYCSFATISGRRVHFHGVERVLEDLAAFKAMVDRAGRRGSMVSVNDDAFTLAPQRARAICEAIIERGLQMPFGCATRVDRVDADLLRLMKRAGFVAVSFGLESAVPHVLRAIGKIQDPATTGDPDYEAERGYVERFRAAVAAAKEAGLTPNVSVIGGLPGETADDFRATLAFVESLRVPTYAHNVLNLLPGTPLYHDRERHGLAAERHATTRAWRTIHAYDVRAVRPAKGSMTYATHWDEANRISDALCGRPRPDSASDGAAWAVVLHRRAPDARTAAWLREVLAVHGTVVAIVPARAKRSSDWEPWVAGLNGADVPWGMFALLAAESRSDGRVVLRAHGTMGQHRFEIDRAWTSSREGIGMDDSGGCRVPIWMASAERVRPPATGAESTLAPQIADGCRWWSGWRRCRAPRVLHVWPDSSVTPCWNGGAIGAVGDAYATLAHRGEALRASGQRSKAWKTDRCPLGAIEGGSPAALVVHACEVTAQLSWLLGGGALSSPDEATPTGGESWPPRSDSRRSSRASSTSASARRRPTTS